MWCWCISWDSCGSLGYVELDKVHIRTGMWATITLSPGQVIQPFPGSHNCIASLRETRITSLFHNQDKVSITLNKWCPHQEWMEVHHPLQSACRSTWIQVRHKDKQSITRHQAQFGSSYVTTSAETDWGMHEIVVQSQSLEEPWKTMAICHFKSVLEVMNTARNFHWLYCRAKACCYPHLPIPLSTKCSKSSVASNTDRNVRPSFSGVIGGHSSPENSTRIASALSLCIQASSMCTWCFVIDCFHCTTRSPQHQLRTFAQDCMCLCTSNTHTHTRFTPSDSAHSHIYMIKMHKTVNSTVVLPQREGAHAWRYIHACHSKHIAQCKLHDHTMIIHAQYSCRPSNQTIRLHHNFQRLHDQDVSFFIYSVQGT